MKETATNRTEHALLLANERGQKEALNCIAELDPTAMEQAKALDALEPSEREKLPLFGIPVLVKDNIDVKGLHTTAGSLALADNLATKDAPIIRNLRKSGAVILGKTNMTEFANYTSKGMPGGYSSRGGQVVHAIDQSVNPSGSSSGSGVAVSAGIVPMAVGTDTSFSVIACAQTNGICGLKPPAGTLSADGIIPIARTLDSAGAMADTFQNALRLYSAMRDEPLPSIEPRQLSGCKLAVNIANRGSVPEGQMIFLESVTDELRQAGAQICEIDQPYTPHQSTIMQWEFKVHLEDYLCDSNASRKTLREIVEYYESHPDTMLKYGDTYLRAALDETPGGLTGEPYLAAMRARDSIAKQVREELQPFDAVLMTGPTNIMHFCGLPSVAIAGGQKDESGIPRGVILYGAEEMKLYATALAIEKTIC